MSATDLIKIISPDVGLMKKYSLELPEPVLTNCITLLGGWKSKYIGIVNTSIKDIENCKHSCTNYPPLKFSFKFILCSLTIKKKTLYELNFQEKDILVCQWKNSLD